MKKVFTSARGPFLTATLVLSGVLPVGAAILLFREGNLLGLVLCLAVAIGLGALVGSVILNCRYVIDGKVLQVECGTWKWSIPTGDIRGVKPTRDPSSAPAMSLDRLELSYASEGRPQTILVSPKDKNGFLNALIEANPQLELQGDHITCRLSAAG